jgi:endonuclease/exonuclease/phosphatase (EEP) superfamily protein YafD
VGRLRASSVVGAALWFGAGLCLAWALVRTFGLERGFPLQALIAWTPFVIPLAVLVAIATGVLRRWTPLACAAIATVLLLVAVAPRALGGGHEPAGADGPELRVLSVNLKLGRADPASVVDLVSENGIDVLCIQELTPEALTRLARAGLSRLLPHEVAVPDVESLGGAILSRFPLRAVAGAEPAGYPFAMPRAAVAIPGAAPVEAVSVHPVPPTSSADVEDWQRGLEALPATGEDRPLTLLIGDFNATLDHRELREVIDRGYVDAGDATGGGLVATWPNRAARPGVTIDHVLADERVAITDYEVHDLPGSDHRAVAAVLRLPSG